MNKGTLEKEGNIMFDSENFKYLVICCTTDSSNLLDDILEKRREQIKKSFVSTVVCSGLVKDTAEKMSDDFFIAVCFYVKYLFGKVLANFSKKNPEILDTTFMMLLLDISTPSNGMFNSVVSTAIYYTFVPFLDLHFPSL